MSPISNKEDEKHTDESTLTPWQKENLKYQKERGEQATWEPKVLSNEEAPAEPELETEETPLEETQPLPRKQSFADRLPNLKKERHRRLLKRMALIISPFLIAIIGLTYYVSPYSKLGVVKVSGNEHIKAADIEKASKLTLGSGLWGQFSNRGQAEAAVKKSNPRIQSAQIQWQFPNELAIKVTEYPEVAWSLRKKEYYPILANGVILEESQKKISKDLPVLEGFEEQKTIESFLKAFKKLPSELQNAVSEIHYAPSKVNPDLVRLYMNDKNQVLVPIETLAEKMAYYPQVAKQMKESGVIDMEAGIFSYPYETESSENDVENQAE